MCVSAPPSRPSSHSIRGLLEKRSAIFRITLRMDFSPSELPPTCGKAKRSDGLQRLEMAAPHTKGESYYDDENIAMAKDRAARSRHLGEHGFRGLGNGPLSAAYGWIDLAIYRADLQRGFLSRLGVDWKRSKQRNNRCWGKHSLSVTRRFDLAIHRGTLHRQLLSWLD